jgi:hypothetical protein
LCALSIEYICASAIPEETFSNRLQGHLFFPFAACVTTVKPDIFLEGVAMKLSL